MTLGISLRQVLKLGQEQRIELGQRLIQMLKCYLPHEFSSFINLEKDEDMELMLKSLPFLAFHELSHPLYDRGGIVEIPLVEEVALSGDHGGPSKYYHNATEVGIDKSAMLLGPRVREYTPQQMYDSHLVMMERVFRDKFQLKKPPIDFTFIARLYCEIEAHQAAVDDSKVKTKLGELMEMARSNMLDLEALDEVAGKYSAVYTGTRLLK